MQEGHLIQDKLILPKFAIRLARRVQSNVNELQLIYDKADLYMDMQSYWSSVDMAVQVYVKQKHWRPSIHRYYFRNNGVYKACTIIN